QIRVMCVVIVGDSRVAVDEAREEIALAEQVEQEVGGDEAEGSLEDHVVDRHEVDLCLPVCRIAKKSIVGLDQGLVEDLLERFAEDLPGAGDMGGDRRRISDHLVLKTL